MLSFELFAATHAIESCSMLNGCLGNIELPLSLSKMFHTFSRHGKVQASLTLLMTYRKSSKSSLLYIIQCLKLATRILLSNLIPNLSAYSRNQNT